MLWRFAIFALPHEPLAHGATGVRRDVLHWRACAGAGVHHDCVFHGAVLLQRVHNVGHG